MRHMLRTRLFYKIFFVVLLSVALGVGIMALIVGYLGYRNFNTYLTETRLEDLSWLNVKLGEYYKIHGSFDGIKTASEDFHSQSESEPFRPDKDVPAPPPGRHDSEDDKEFMKRTFLDSTGQIRPEMLIRLEHFLVLQDKHRRMITGDEKSHEQFVFRPILSDGAVVGYLGMRKPPNIKHPLALGFLKQQGSHMTVSGLLIIILTGALSWYFTKRVLAPVNSLIGATKMISARDFSFQLSRESNDELGDLAENFQNMADELQKYEINQNRWISDISHELRTPLSVILGSIEAMQDGVRKADDSTLGILHAEVRRLIRLVNDLHEITMAESGNMKFNFAIERIDNIIKSVADMYTMRAEEYGFHIEQVTSGCRVMVRADVSRLRQVFINLIENSLKHAKGPGSILISCVEKDGRAVITFEDMGPGVPEEHIPMLFDRLFRSDISRNRKTGGSGLGLAICRYITEQHGGSISARTGSMGGLKIEIILPMEHIDE
ncbi:MAG: ATP-binding protein [Deferribacterales bacterium]